MKILLADFNDPRLSALLKRHVAHGAYHTPSAVGNILDIEELKRPEITFWTIWEGEYLLGFGALKEFEPGHGEIKSMHTAEEYRGRGVASRLVVHIIKEARRRGYTRISLETGSPEGFAAARALYRSHGFEEGPRFGDYPDDPASFFMTRTL